ncbi:HlyD family secretion protein [Tropicimonas marinistellae]|uniref:HlyD family secretion protein n=1 Tax=Tropicimonas marinistellae TaxID=1739787 RepID=UPI00082EA2A5|nr:biotin/lipoyl-binding protein [Tropicimonas marinistellae]
MFELMFCGLFTVLPDYLYRRFAQGKRFGRELTLFSVWYELRYGLTGCLMLTITLITIVFYYHPSTTDATSFFRTVSILPEKPGRVKEVMVVNGERVEAGDVLFALDDSAQRAAVLTAESKVKEIEVAFVTADAELAAAESLINQAKAALNQAQEEFDVRNKLLTEGSPATSEREVERLQNVVDERIAGLDSAEAQKQAVEAKINEQLPAQLASAEASLAQAEVELEKTVVSAAITGDIQQFGLQPGDVVNPLLRPAGVLVAAEVMDGEFQAGFKQVNKPVIKVGMIGEITCASLPMKIVPMQVSYVQEYVAAGQFRPSDQLVDIQDRARPGTIAIRMSPLFEGGTDQIPPGSKCIANLYTNNHDVLHGDEDLSVGRWLFLHMVDTVGLLHALILRIQAMLLPVQTLVLSGH